MNTSTRGLNHSVTPRRTLCNAGRRETTPDSTKTPERAETRPEASHTSWGKGRYFLSPPLPWSPPAPMDS